jgi:membrane protein DedA with SNARE-associated domain/rhodanese-related sulfurtransferase
MQPLWLTDAPSVAFWSVLAGSLGVPIPAAAALILAGSLFQSHGGGLAFGMAIFASAMLGAAVGDVLWFMLGRKYGGRAMGLLCRFSLSRDSCVRRTADYFARRGLKMLLFAKFVPGLSLIGAPLAGATGIVFGRYALYAAAGDALWVVSFLAVGYCFAGELSDLVVAMAHYGIGLGGAVALLLVVYVGFRWIRRRQLLNALATKRISVDELRALVTAGLDPIIIDARSDVEAQLEPDAIPGSRRVDLAALSDALRDIAPHRTVVVYCSCPNEVSAAAIGIKIRALGFTDVRRLLGGIDAWRGANPPMIAPAGRVAPFTST